MRESLSIVIMAYNEEESLDGVVRETLDVLERLERPHELLIVNDGSTDGTEAVAVRLETEIPAVRAIHHPVNLGLGEVYRTGFRSATSDWMAFLPGDGQIPADDLVAFADAMDGFDMVLGTIPQRRVPFYVKALSFTERAIYHLLFGRFPRFQGAVMFRRALLDEIVLTSTGRGWTVLMELILRASRGGFRLTHAPTRLRARTAGESKVNNLANIGSNLRQVLALRRQL